MRIVRWLETLDDKVGEFVDRFGMLTGAALMLLALTGEVLGWWNDLGLVMTLAGLGLALWSVWGDNGQQILELLGVQQGFLVHMTSKQDAMLETQDAMLDKQDRTIDVLDRIQAILDARLPGGI